MREVIAKLDPADLVTVGYPIETLWKPLDEALGGTVTQPAKPKLDRYRLERKAIMALRNQAKRGGIFRKLLLKAKLTCDVLLRE